MRRLDVLSTQHRHSRAHTYAVRCEEIVDKQLLGGDRLQRTPQFQRYARRTARASRYADQGPGREELICGRKNSLLFENGPVAELFRLCRAIAC